MNDLIQAIREKNYALAEQLFNEKMEQLAERTLQKKKKKVANKVEYPFKTEVERTGSVTPQRPPLKHMTKVVKEEELIERKLQKRKRKNDTILVTLKGDKSARKTGGGVKRIPKSEYNERLHNLALEEGNKRFRNHLGAKMPGDQVSNYNAEVKSGSDGKIKSISRSWTVNPKKKKEVIKEVSKDLLRRANASIFHRTLGDYTGKSFNPPDSDKLSDRHGAPPKPKHSDYNKEMDRVRVPVKINEMYYHCLLYTSPSPRDS